MIEISARLLNKSAFFAGENVECCVTFSNPKNPDRIKSHGSGDFMETLALASAQIHCQCTTNDKMIKKRETNNISTATSADTSFAPCKNDNGYVVLSTKPKILFCDLRLPMGESKSFMYNEILPGEAPPSYRGLAIKYSYKITIGTQRVNSPIKLVRIPLRVLVISGLNDSGTCNDSEDLIPNNPFLDKEQKDSPLELSLQMLQNATSRRNPNFYNITNVHGKVVRFCLFKQAFKLGEDIVGTFDFTDATVSCVQYSVTLQSEEEVHSDHKFSNKQGPTIVSYNKQHEFCLNWKYTQLILPIPFHITPTFKTNLVSLHWRLHFEFVTSSTSNKSEVMNDEKSDVAWQGPSSLNIETMVWNLPIKILPTPHLVTQGLNFSAKYSNTV